MKYKEKLLSLDEKKEDEKVEGLRQEMSRSEYSSLNMAMSVVENDILIALLFKHLPYEFKQKLGLEWTIGKESWKENKEVMDKNRNSIKREFIRVALSDKSVNFSKDLQGMLEGIMQERYGSILSEVDKKLDEKYKNMKASIKEKIANFKKATPSKGKEAPKAGEKHMENTKPAEAEGKGQKDPVENKKDTPKSK